MRKRFSKKFQYLPKAFALFIVLLHSQIVGAVQDAQVIVERAVIYADEKMSSPIGFVKRGKRIKVGNVAKNKGQVYSIIVSGKIAYIRVNDLSTEKESVDSDRLVVERFQKASRHSFKSNTSILLLMNSSQISLENENGELKDKDAITWTGISFKGGVQSSRRFDFELLLNYLTAEEGEEKFQILEFGGGGALRVFERSRFIVRLTGHLLTIPFATYAIGDLFRVNGYGYGLGGGLNLSYRLTENWGIETYGGMHYMKLMSIDPPSNKDYDFKSIEPTFIGTRLGAGLNYQF